MMNDKVKKWMISALLLLSISSCQKDEQTMSKNSDPIHILFSINNQEWLHESRASNSENRLIDNTNMYDSFGCWAFEQSFSGSNKNLQAIQGITNLKVSKSNAYATDILWPAQAANVQFYAYAPKDNSNIMVNDITANTLPLFTYECPTDVSKQVDLLTTSTTILPVNYRKPVTLNFYHTLSAIYFTEKQLPEGSTITSINLSHVISKGTFNFASLQNNSPSDISSRLNNAWDTMQTSMPQPPTYANYDLTLNYQRTGTQTPINTVPLLLIPQRLGEESLLTVTLKDASQQVQQYKKTLNTFTWNAGKKTVYNLSIDNGKLEIVPEGLADWEYGGEL